MRVVVLRILKFLDENDDWQSAETIGKQFNMTRQEAAQYLAVLKRVGLVINDTRCRMNGEMKPVLYCSIRCGSPVGEPVNSG